MSQIFEKGATDSLFDRIDKDETGELRHLVLDLIETCKRVSELGVPMDELATCCTLAWYMGQSPEFNSLLEVLMKGITIPENLDN
tara:strand:+ start:38 stop:292 length:255 start_codon:yes stop_codon:yes gene_type:complete